MREFIFKTENPRVKPHNPVRDYTPAEIRFCLAQKGYTYARVEREYPFLSFMSASKATRVALEYPEYAIAEVLETHPAYLWPSRYDSALRRLDPQPQSNYEQSPVKSNVNNISLIGQGLEKQDAS